MKGIGQILFGAGLAGLAVMLWVSLQQAQTVRTDAQAVEIGIDKEFAEFDKEFDEMSAKISGTKLSRERLEKHDARINAEEDRLANVRKQQAVHNQINQDTTDSLMRELEAEAARNVADKE